MNKQTIVWIDALLDGTISQEDFQQLESLLKSDPTALEHYCGQAEIHGRLEWELGNPENTHLPIQAPVTLSRKSTPLHRPLTLWLPAAALIVLMLGLALRNHDPAPSNNSGTSSGPVPETTTPDKPTTPPAKLASEGISMARLTKSLDADWMHEPPLDGTWLKPGNLHLLSGSAEITFDSGARIILQGPAEIRLITPYHANLTRGKAITHIPRETEGFVLDTPSSSFSRNNTSFAVAIAADGSAEVHAIRGLVEATPRANPALARLLSENQTIRFTNTSVLTERKVRHALGSFNRELPSSIDSVPSRFLHWSLDREYSKLLSETGHHEGPPFPARMLARPGTAGKAHAELVNGKYGRAISFNGHGAFLSSGFPGIAGSSSRTVAFWVRVPADAERPQAYSMVAWGSPHSQTGEKWQVSWNTGVDNRSPVGAIRTEFGGGFVIGTTDLRDGAWHHVACVFLGGESVNVATHIRHYVDGQLEPVTASKSKTINTRLAIPSSLPTYFGRRLENDNPSSGFNGSLDEIYIFPAALTPRQIGQLYRENTPPDRLIPAH